MTIKERREFLASRTRTELRHDLRLLRREAARPWESNPAAAQYDVGLYCTDPRQVPITASSVRAEYHRRGWKAPKPTPWERPERPVTRTRAGRSRS